MLAPGQTFVCNGLVYKVVHVNECRAHCRSISRQEREIAGKPVLMPVGQTLDISPTAPVELLADLTRLRPGVVVSEHHSAPSRSEREESRQRRIQAYLPVNPLLALGLGR